MALKWSKVKLCKDCGGDLFRVRRFRWDWNDKTVESESCFFCGSYNNHFVKHGDAAKLGMKLDVIEESEEHRSAFGIIQDLIDLLTGPFGLPSEVGNAMFAAGLRVIDKLAGRPYNSGDWGTGMIVPTPPTPHQLTGGWQATGLRPDELEEKGWRDDFTHEEYKEWRKTLKEGD